MGKEFPRTARPNEMITKEFLYVIFPYRLGIQLELGLESLNKSSPTHLFPLPPILWMVELNFSPNIITASQNLMLFPKMHEIFHRAQDLLYTTYLQAMFSFYWQAPATYTRLPWVTSGLQLQRMLCFHMISGGSGHTRAQPFCMTSRRSIGYARAHPILMRPAEFQKAHKNVVWFWELLLLGIDKHSCVTQNVVVCHQWPNGCPGP